VASEDFRKCSGDYLFYGHTQGFAGFIKRDPSSDPFAREQDESAFFLYRTTTHDDANWRLGSYYGSFRSFLKGPSGEELPETDGTGKWTGNDGREHEITITPLEPEEDPRNPADFVKELLLQFLHLRNHSDYEQLFTLASNELVHVKMGPPKSLGRALEKGPDWLLDLNRATLIFDSATVLVVAFHLLEARVQEKGGHITRLSNYFLKHPTSDNPMHSLSRESMTKPPCVHIQFSIQDWAYEVLFMLSDFVDAKDTLHKFYELLRAPDLLAALQPVFDARGDVCESDQKPEV